MGKDKAIFTNRELSWLDFNYRVLEEVDDSDNPLFERLKFLAITSSNLDEFFMVRVAGLGQQVDYGVTKMDNTNTSPAMQLEKVLEKCHKFCKSQYQNYKKLMKLCNNEGIYIVDIQELSKSEQEYIDKYYYELVQPVLTPLAIDSSRPFPRLAGKKLNIAIALQKKGNEGEVKNGIIQLPTVLPRFIQLPDSNRYLLLESVIMQHANEFFNGYQIKDMLLFRLTRNSDLSIDEDAQDLLTEIEKSLDLRKRGTSVRLEIMKNPSICDHDCRLSEFLIEQLEVKSVDVFHIDGPLDLTFLFGFAADNRYSHLKFPMEPPQEAMGIKMDSDIFAEMRQRDILLHHPYESFDRVVDMVVQAASDRRVLAIKQTLYRVSGNSPIVAALIKAAKSGKQVTVLVELKARFDEENNIAWAKRLEQAGCHVIYGLQGLKVHCKALLIVRREDNIIKRYVHLGTGNYNDKTAKLYTDFGLLTTNYGITSDVAALFNVLTGYSLPPRYKKIHVAPAGLRKFFEEKIDAEISNHKLGLDSGIVVKVNSLIDERIIRKLYEASSAGVKIELIVRGINGLRSQIEGLSENIRVISIIGRYLEHHRIFHFVSGGDNEVYLSSADWMSRNLDRRIETLFPIEDEDNKERVLATLKTMLGDNVKARVQQNDGSYTHVVNDEKKLNSQNAFYKEIKNFHRQDYTAPDVIYKPKKKISYDDV